MADPADNPTQPTKLAWALGALQAEMANQTQETARNREALEALPTKVTEAIMPRVVILEGKASKADERLNTLEKDKAFLRGGLLILLVATSYVIGKPYIPKF